MEEKKLKASEALVAALEKDPHVREDDAQDIAKAMQQDAVRDLSNAIDQGKKQFGNKDFFIEMFIYQYQTQTRNQIKNSCVVGPLCPTPTHGHAVWMVHGNTGNEELLWSLPPVEQCIELLNAKPSDLALGDLHLLDYIKDFMEYKLREKAVRLNKKIEARLQGEIHV